eukprot:scaffold6520_cov32-Tisochrysis_lutea.AAC.2
MARAMYLWPAARHLDGMRNPHELFTSRGRHCCAQLTIYGQRLEARVQLSGGKNAQLSEERRVLSCGALDTCRQCTSAFTSACSQRERGGAGDVRSF